MFSTMLPPAGATPASSQKRTLTVAPALLQSIAKLSTPGDRAPQPTQPGPAVADGHPPAPLVTVTPTPAAVATDAAVDSRKRTEPDGTAAHASGKQAKRIRFEQPGGGGGTCGAGGLNTPVAPARGQGGHGQSRTAPVPLPLPCRAPSACHSASTGRSESQRSKLLEGLPSRRPVAAAPPATVCKTPRQPVRSSRGKDGPPPPSK